MTTRRWMISVAVIALLIVIVPEVIRELRRRYIIGSPATERNHGPGRRTLD